LCEVTRVLPREDPASQSFEASELGQSKSEMSGHFKDLDHSIDTGVERDQPIGLRFADEKDVVHDLNRIDDVQVKQVHLAAPDHDKAILQQPENHVAKQTIAPKPNRDEQDIQGSDSDKDQPLNEEAQIAEQEEYRELNLQSSPCTEQEEAQAIVDPDPFGASKLFMPSGISLALEVKAGAGDHASDPEHDTEIMDPDPFGASKFFGRTGDALGFGDGPVMIQDNLPPMITYRRKSSKRGRQRLPAEDRLLDFISNNDAAEIFNSEEFRTLLADANKEQAENGNPENLARPNWVCVDEDVSTISEEDRNLEEDRDSEQDTSIEARRSFSDDNDENDGSDDSSYTVGKSLHEYRKQKSQAILGLTENQLVHGQARFHIFEKVQMIRLYRSQHRLARKLESYFDEHKTKGDTNLITDLDSEVFEDRDWIGIEEILGDYR
jgi:hypothetical protein